MSKSLDRRFEQYEQVLVSVLGSIETWPPDELAEFLADAGIDLDAAERGLYARIDVLAGTFRAQNKNVPRHIQEFLRQLRPPDVRTSDPVVAQSVADTFVAKLLKGQVVVSNTEFAHAFREKKGELDPNDRALLDSLETRLRKRRREGA